MLVALNPDSVDRWLHAQPGFIQLDERSQLALRLIALLVEVDDLTTVVTLLNELLEKETEGAEDSSVLLLPVISDDEIPGRAKRPKGTDHECFIGDINYNEILTPNLGSEGPVSNALRNFSRRSQCIPLTDFEPYSSTAFRSGAVSKIVLATDFCASGNQAVSSIKRFTESAAFEMLIESEAGGERPQITLLTAAATSEAISAINENARVWIEQGWAVSCVYGKEVLSLWGDWIPFDVRTMLYDAILELPLHNNKKGRPRENVRNWANGLRVDLWEGGKELFDLKKKAPGELRKLGFGYMGAAALYANQMTIPNTLPGFLTQKTALDPLFPKRMWSNVVVDLKDLIVERDNYRLDPSIRPLLLGTQLVKRSGDSECRRLFDFSFFSNYLDFLGALDLGISSLTLREVFGFRQDEVLQYTNQAVSMGAIVAREREPEVTETGKKLLWNAEKEIFQLSELNVEGPDRKNLARDTFMRYNR